MSLTTLIDKATEKAGNQIKLAEMLGVQQQVVSAWRTGRRTCTTPARIELCKIADYDLKVALIEQVIEGLDPADDVQADAAKMLQAVVNAFPNAGYWRRLSLADIIRRALRAVVRLSLLVDKALHNTVRHPIALTNAL